MITPNYTHVVNYFGKMLKCKIYTHIPKDGNMVYIRLEDSRSMWWNINRMIKIN